MPGVMTRSTSSPIMRVSIFRFSVAMSLRLTIRGSQHLLAAEGEQLAGQRRGAFGGAGDFLGRAAKMRLVPETFEEKFRVSGDHHQEIVEVVRDPAGQAAHGLHLLRLAQLLFQGAALGDIFREEFEDHAFFTAVDHGTPRDSNHGGAALALPFGDYSFERFGGAQAIRELEPLFGIGVEAVNVMSTQFVGGTKPKQFEECRIGIENLASRVATANAVRCVGNERTKIRLRTPQIFLGGAQRTR